MSKQLPPGLESQLASVIEKARLRHPKLLTEAVKLHAQCKLPVMLVVFALLSDKDFRIRQRTVTLENGLTENQVIEDIKSDPDFVLIADYSMVINNKIWGGGYPTGEIIDTDEGHDINHIPDARMSATEAYRWALTYETKARDIYKKEGKYTKEAKRLFRQVYSFAKFSGIKTNRPDMRIVFYNKALEATVEASMVKEAEEIKTILFKLKEKM